MTDDRTRARTLLDAWRERGADRVDPLRFRLIDALERRAAGYGGDVRRRLDERLDALLDAYANEVERAMSAAAATGTADGHREPAAQSGLAALTDYLANRARADHATPCPASWPELEMLDYFRTTWSRVSADRQLRQSREQVPANAGPLNSSSLVHRSLSLMRELSPGYLQQFLSYVDALSWLEQLNGGYVPAPGDTRDTHTTRRATGAKKGARSKPR